jgi:hypothetical protein
MAAPVGDLHLQQRTVSRGVAHPLANDFRRTNMSQRQEPTAPGEDSRAWWKGGEEGASEEKEESL